jgi:hypothetical protein
MKKLIALLTVFGIQLVFCKEKKQETVIVTSSAFTNPDDLLYAPIEDFLYSPVKGLKCFFKHKFNNPKYSTDILPYSLRDLTDFLIFCKKTDLDRAFVRDIFRIFKQKLSTTEFICPTELAKTFNQFPDLVSHLIKDESQEKKEAIQKIIKKEIKNAKKADFKEKNIESMTNKILAALKEESIDICTDELCSIVFSFTEISLGKALWSCHENADTWEEFKALGDSIYQMHSSKIICDEAKTNDLIIELISAFTRSIKLRAADLSYEFYEQAKDDLENETLDWLMLEEADELITPKVKELTDFIFGCEIKARAKKEYGIIPTKDLL